MRMGENAQAVIDGVKAKLKELAPSLPDGVEVVPVLIGAFGIPQIIEVLKDKFQIGKAQKLQRIIPEIGTVVRNIPAIGRSAMIGVDLARRAAVFEQPFKTCHQGIGFAAQNVQLDICDFHDLLYIGGNGWTVPLPRS